jgi:hypothetical protein
MMGNQRGQKAMEKDCWRKCSKGKVGKNRCVRQQGPLPAYNASGFGDNVTNRSMGSMHVSNVGGAKSSAKR